MPKSRFEASYTGIGEMLRSKMIRDAMEDRANFVRDIAVILSPTDSGRYVNSWEVSTGIKEDGKRCYARVTNTAPYAAAIEYGNRNARRQRILGKAMNITFQLG